MRQVVRVYAHSIGAQHFCILAYMRIPYIVPPHFAHASLGADLPANLAIMTVSMKIACVKSTASNLCYGIYPSVFWGQMVLSMVLAQEECCKYSVWHWVLGLGAIE
jgi:hypothetical protein